MVEGIEGKAARALKLFLGIFLAFIAAFFVVQASLGARRSATGWSAAPKGGAPGEGIYRSVEGLLDGLANALAQPLEPGWELAVDGEVFMDCAGDALYLTSTSGKVMAVNAATGGILWSLDLRVWISAPPSAQEGVVYVGATDHVLYAFDAGSGALLWYYTTQGEILARPVVGDGMVFVTADNDSVYDLVHRLYALDARSGRLLWTYDTESWTPSPPAVGASALYLGGYRREVYALEKSSGRELWSFKASNIVLSSPQIAGDKLLFTCIDGWVYALKAEDGAPLWSRKLPGFAWLSPPDGSGRVYACSRRSTLSALSLDSGDKAWDFDDGDLISCAAMAGTGALCVFNAAGKVYVLDAAEGELLKRLASPHGFASPPLLAGRTLYASSQDGFVRAYTLYGSGLP